jgi:hypothetical protein
MPDWSGYRSMVFVDGENFTIRGQKFAQAHGLKLLQAATGNQTPTFGYQRFTAKRRPLREDHEHRAPITTTAVVGDDEKLTRARLAIREMSFDPDVFKKSKGTRSKGVDVSLTTGVVAHAYPG